MELRLNAMYLLCTIFLVSRAEEKGISKAASISSISKNINQFGYDLLIKSINQKKNDNIAISPTGVAGLAAMALLGSVGRTYDELANALGFSKDILMNRLNHEQLGEMFVSLRDNETSSRTEYADVAFVDAETRLREVYRTFLARVYRGDALNVDFQRGLEVKHMINEWVKNHTHYKIENFLKDPLPANTKIVLLSALYFAGQWAQPFLPEQTKSMSFKKSSGEVTAQFMLNFGQFKYIFSKEIGLHMIALPYNDSVTTMYLMKPRFPRKLTLTDLMNRLDYSNIDTLIDQMTERKCVLRIPKMKVHGKMNLEESLKAMGIQSMFNPEEANFALMIDSNADVNKTEEELVSRFNTLNSEDTRLKEIIGSLKNPKVHVDSVIHEVKLNIDEFGTEAVAATSGILSRTAEQFYADSPFYMFIRNERHKLVTFSVVVNDPTENVE